jgi:hypothetical protein
MTTPGQPDFPEPPETSEHEVRMSRFDRRREKIRREIERDRQGDHRVPTWVLALILVLFVAGWAYLIWA